MVVGQTQCFTLALVIAAAVGVHRGWMREVITCAILLGTVLFLNFGGLDFLLGGVGNVASGATGGIASADPATCSPATKQTITTGLFGLLTYLGYRAGSRYGSPAQHSGHRIAGIIPGALNGAAIAYLCAYRRNDNLAFAGGLRPGAARAAHRIDGRGSL